MIRRTILICAGLAVMFPAGRVSAPKAENAQPNAPGVAVESGAEAAESGDALRQ